MVFIIGVQGTQLSLNENQNGFPFEATHQRLGEIIEIMSESPRNTRIFYHWYSYGKIIGKPVGVMDH